MSQDLLDAAFDGDIAKVKSLLDHGANVNYADPLDNTTALMNASRRGHFEIVKTLVEVGANVNAQDIYGNSSLVEAVRGACDIEQP